MINDTIDGTCFIQHKRITGKLFQKNKQMQLHMKDKQSSVPNNFYNI